jgi:hypothetical protein
MGQVVSRSASPPLRPLRASSRLARGTNPTSLGLVGWGRGAGFAGDPHMRGRCQRTDADGESCFVPKCCSRHAPRAVADLVGKPHLRRHRNGARSVPATKSATALGECLLRRGTVPDALGRNDSRCVSDLTRAACRHQLWNRRCASVVCFPTWASMSIPQFERTWHG